MININDIKTEMQEIKIRLSAIINFLKEKNFGQQNIDDMNIIINSLNRLLDNIKEK